jgi:hypothetical protein
MQLRPLTRHSEQERYLPYMLSTMYIHLISLETRYEVPVLQGRFILMQHPYLLSHRDGSLWDPLRSPRAYYPPDRSAIGCVPIDSEESHFLPGS